MNQIFSVLSRLGSTELTEVCGESAFSYSPSLAWIRGQLSPPPHGQQRNHGLPGSHGCELNSSVESVKSVVQSRAGQRVAVSGGSDCRGVMLMLEEPQARNGLLQF